VVIAVDSKLFAAESHQYLLFDFLLSAAILKKILQNGLKE
jgi:hypothetical protein